MPYRDIPAELRELVADNFLEGTPLATAVLAIADALEEQAAGTAAQLNALSERLDDLAASVGPEVIV